MAARLRTMLSLLLLFAVGSWSFADDSASFSATVKAVLTKIDALKGSGKQGAADSFSAVIEPVFAKIEALQKSGKKEAAQEALQQLEKSCLEVLEHDADNNPTRLLLCHAQFELEKYDAALENVELVVKQDGDNVNLHALKANLLGLQKKVPRSGTIVPPGNRAQTKSESGVSRPVRIFLDGCRSRAGSNDDRA